MSQLAREVWGPRKGARLVTVAEETTRVQSQYLVCELRRHPAGWIPFSHS